MLSTDMYAFKVQMLFSDKTVISLQKDSLEYISGIYIKTWNTNIPCKSMLHNNQLV